MSTGQFHAESLKFDKRLVSMNERSGVLQPGEYERSKEALPDLQHNAVALNIKGDSVATSPSVDETPAAPMQDTQPLQVEQQDNSESAFTSPADTEDKPNTSGGGGFFGM